MRGQLGNTYSLGLRDVSGQTQGRAVDLPRGLSSHAVTMFYGSMLRPLQNSVQGLVDLGFE